MMDPASATVAFVGFAASIATLCGLIIESSRTLYELQDKVRTAPDELRKLCATLKSLESLLLEIQRRSPNLDNLNISLELRESWNATLSLLEAAMASLQEWLAQKFGSLDLEPLGRKALRQRVTFFFADKKLGALHRSIDEHIHRLGFLQGLIISSQCQNLEAQYRDFPSLISRVQDEVTLGTSKGLQMIQGLRSDIFKLHQTQFTAFKNLDHTHRVHGEHHGSIQARRKANRICPIAALPTDPPVLLSANQHRSSIRTEAKLLNVICSLPIGSLYYVRGHKKSISTEADFGIAEATEEQWTLSFNFAPANWISNVLVQLTIEMCRRQDQILALSIRLKDPPRICTDKEVIKSLGMLYDDELRVCQSGDFGSKDPGAFRGYLLQGRLRANDVICSEKLGSVVSNLEAVLADLRDQPRMTYQICETLLTNGARVDVMSSGHGNPLYIASGGGGLEVVSFRERSGPRSFIGTTYYRNDILDTHKIKEIKAIQQLLLRHNATFDTHLPCRGPVTAWSGEHGWLPRLLSLSHDPEYLRQVLFDNLTLFEIQDFGQCDRWLIAILCHTFPILRAALAKQHVPPTGSSLTSFTSDLELATVIEQVKAASPPDRCFLIGSICQYGTVEMLQPFLQGDFDLNERSTWIWWLPFQPSRYFCHAAKLLRFDIMNALIGAGFRITELKDLLGVFRGLRVSQLYRKCDTIPFIDLVFATFDFEACHEKESILGAIFRWSDSLLSKFEDPWIALSYMSTCLIRRGCFLARPPISLDRILINELFEFIRAGAMPDLEQKKWVLYVINEYKINLQGTAVTFSSFEEGLSFNVTALGLSLELEKLEITQVLLDAGANIHDPIVGGRSALEIAKENLQKGPRRASRGLWHRRENEAFEMIIDALKIRSLDSIADEAVLDVQEFPPGTELQEHSGAKRFRTLLGYFLAREPYHRATAWRFITAVTMDGIFVRMSFIFSISFVICFEVWMGLNELILGKRPPVFILRLVVVVMLVVVFAIKLQYSESRAYTIL